MNEISPSIWQQNKKGDWRLYFNTESQINTQSTSSNNQIKIKKNNISENNRILGTLVKTLKRIGRLIKNNEGMGIIRFKDGIKEE